MLALALRDNAVVAYDAERAKVAPWSAARADAETTNALASMPGQICALSFDPTPGSSVLLAQTPAAIARLDLAAGGPGGGGGVSKRREARRPGARREAEQTQAQERRGRVS